uniref:hypothetical protein n=1 Tax=Enterocloster clostridioformis TaxID=1531 RepID=UPI002676E62A|nr:hypothetical protein [Enterocloster clostridioformis]
MRRKTIDTIPVLSDAMKNILSAFSKSRSLPSGLVKRASIVLPASQGELNQNIAPQDGLHYNNAAAWRSRFLAALPALWKQLLCYLLHPYYTAFFQSINVVAWCKNFFWGSTKRQAMQSSVRLRILAGIRFRTSCQNACW